MHKPVLTPISSGICITEGRETVARGYRETVHYFAAQSAQRERLSPKEERGSRRLIEPLQSAHIPNLYLQGGEKRSIPSLSKKTIESERSIIRKECISTKNRK